MFYFKVKIYALPYLFKTRLSKPDDIFFSATGSLIFSEYTISIKGDFEPNIFFPRGSFDPIIAFPKGFFVPSIILYM